MSWYEELDQKMADYLPDVPVLREEPLSRHTSFRIGGPARRMAFPKSGEQLVLLVSFARACGARPFILGNGTNLLFGDGETDVWRSRRKFVRRRKSMAFRKKTS